MAHLDESETQPNIRDTSIPARPPGRYVWRNVVNPSIGLKAFKALDDDKELVRIVHSSTPRGVLSSLVDDDYHDMPPRTHVS